ncbi:hypothetical protein ACL02S_15900 [Nocardia sp. 004]|uniref:hypothetical protein n=1 Tax=Nocardia sp. 004 TaxID=3385978 RepID=UPI0039A12740
MKEEMLVVDLTEGRVLDDVPEMRIFEDEYSTRAQQYVHTAEDRLDIGDVT